MIGWQVSQVPRVIGAGLFFFCVHHVFVCLVVATDSNPNFDVFVPKMAISMLLALRTLRVAAPLGLAPMTPACAFHCSPVDMAKGVVYEKARHPVPTITLRELRYSTQTFDT